MATISGYRRLKFTQEQLGRGEGTMDAETNTHEAGMMTKRRGQQTATAYDYRRCIALVQTLAHYDSFDGLRALAASWGVEEPTYEELKVTGSWTHVMARKLAQHVLAHGRGEANGDG